MPVVHARVDGDHVKIYALPPATEAARARFIRFARSDDVFGYDVETTAIDEDAGAFGVDMSLRMVQFGTAYEAWCLDAHNPLWRRVIRTMLRSESRRFVSHSGYDSLWARREFAIDLRQRALDTLPMAALLRPSDRGGNDLKTLSGVYIDSGLILAEEAMLERFKELAPVGHRVHKKLKAWGFSNIALDDPAFTRYGGLDAIYVRRLRDILGAELKEQGMAKLAKREQRIARMAVDMQWRGHQLDLDRTRSLLKEISAEWGEADTWLAEAMGFSPRSPRRGDWLEEHGAVFAAAERTPSGRPRLDKESVPDYAFRYRDDELLGQVFAHYETLSTRGNLKTNLTSLLAAAGPDGKVHPRINIAAARTGRMSITSPAMQTFKKDGDKRLRGCFIAYPDVFVTADYDTQETRIAAAFSGDPALWKIVTEGLNMHEMTAELIFGSEFVSKAETPFIYHKAKTADFAQQYGAGPKKMAAQLGISLREARELWAGWRKAYAGLVRWTEHAATASEIVNPWGRIIPADPKRPYANGNYAIQSTGRDVLGDAMVRIEDAGYGQYIWLPVHDELVLKVPPEMAEEACRMLEREMTCEIRGITLTATAEIVGARWNGEK